ncbi:MAG: DUF2442 domain-containing protein [Leptolyngbya sp. ERB_1_1]
MNKHHDVQGLDFDDEHLYLTVDGQTYEISIAQASSRLANATHAERYLYRIAPSGYGIHWFAIDEDLSINGLLKLAIVKS